LKAVANSSVLIALSAIGQLELLSQRFLQGILIPKALWREEEALHVVGELER
jgi:predicted nucleic acid-binding protein